jgi:hypothetical protein
MTAAARALEALLELLADAELEATRDAGAFRPEPVGVLVGLPSLVDATLGALVFTIPVLVVSGEPLNTPAAVDRLYLQADAVAEAVRTLAYRPSVFSGSSRAEPLPAVEIIATVTVSEEEGS